MIIARNGSTGGWTMLHPANRPKRGENNCSMFLEQRETVALSGRNELVLMLVGVSKYHSAVAFDRYPIIEAHLY
jgi:hypothetical protein